jgi:hypothetical protein
LDAIIRLLMANPGEPPHEPATRWLLGLAGIAVIAIAISVLLVQHETSLTTETTTSAGASTKKVTDVSSGASDSLALGVFSVGGALVLAGAFFERLSNLKVKVGQQEFSASFGGKTVPLPGGGTLQMNPAQVVSPEGKRSTLSLEPELLFKGGEEEEGNAAESRTATYRIEDDTVKMEFATIPRGATTVRWRNLAIGSRGGSDTHLSFSEIGLKVGVNGEPERALFLPVSEGTLPLRGIVFFVPPAAARIEWFASWTWPGLWKPLREKGHDVGGMDVLEAITKKTTKFVFPPGSRNLRLTVEKDKEQFSPNVAYSTEDDRPVMTWVIDTKTDGHGRFDYEIDAELPKHPSHQTKRVRRVGSRTRA